jgi:hypothetical protein
VADLEGGSGGPRPTLRFSPRVKNLCFFCKKV